MPHASMLLVEDDAALAELLVYHFKREDFEVTQTPDGEEALLLAKEKAPDIVLLDWMVEGISGIEVCRRLRQEGKAASTVSVKIRYEDFETLDHSRTLPQPDNRDDALYSVANDLMQKAITRRVGIRLIGVGLSNLTHCYHQMHLFDEGAWLKERRRLIAVDKMRQRFGFDAVLRGEAVYLINCASSYRMSCTTEEQP